MASKIAPKTLHKALTDGAEIALLDVREEGAFADGHLLYAVSCPLSRLELVLPDLVPRASTRIVLCDDGKKVADRAAEIMTGFGYPDVRVLDGGIKGWVKEGLEIFTGINVPSKAFGEFVEEHYETPSVSAEELKALMDKGENMVVLDSRPMDEYHRMSIPTGIDCPGAELAYRVHDAVTDPETLIVVNCAGRTRSIIGAQSLINAGVSNRVVALRNGTMGWELSGFTCDRGKTTHAADPSDEGLVAAKVSAARVAERFGVETIDMETFAAWRSEADRRTLYAFDVRTPEEYEASHFAGSVYAPGGQLVQATDKYVAVKNARMVLIDDTGVRATMTASWLKQMGWNDVYVLKGALDSDTLAEGKRRPAALGEAQLGSASLAVDDLKQKLDDDAVTLIDVDYSLSYRKGHIPAAYWSTRVRLGETLKKLDTDKPIVVTSSDGRLARYAADDAMQILGKPVRFLKGGTGAWVAAGHALEESEDRQIDTPDDKWLRPYDRKSGIEEAMNDYLSWEVDLVRQIERDGTSDFPAHAR